MTNFGTRAVASLAGLPDFIAYLAVAFALVALFVLIYTLITPQRELPLIRAGNSSAAISLGGAILGFAIPLAMSIAQSHDLLDMALWSIGALIVQLGVFFLCGALIGQVPRRITDNELATAFFLALTAVAAGVINAACMTSP